MALPVTGISNSFDFILLLTSFLVILARSKRTDTRTSPALSHVRSYLGYFAIFNLLMALPCLLLYIQSEKFPIAMGWGYTVANVFLLISLSHISRTIVKLLPKFAPQERIVQVVWVVLNVAMTGLNIYFVALHNNPTFSSATGVTQFHFPSFISAILGTISLLAYLPVVVVFAMNTFSQLGSARLRSALLSVGLVMIMIVGPLHAAASNWKVFMLADILNMVSLLLITGGVLYKLAPASAENKAVSPLSTPQAGGRLA